MSPTKTIPSLLSEGADRFGSHIAVVDGPTRITYTELATQARTVARAYLTLGIRPGDRIAIWLPNRAEYILAMLGAQSLGASVVPVNTRYRGHEAREILERSRASALVVCTGFLNVDYVAMLANAAAEESDQDGPVPGLGSLCTVIDVGDGTRADTLPWSEFLAGAGRASEAELAAAEAEVTPDTVCDILFTSGTTGVPKGVMSAHRQTIGTAEVWARGAGLSESDSYAVINPFFHSFGYKAGIVAALTSGTTVYPVTTFDVEGLLALVERERITVLPGAPTIFTTLINHPKLADYDLSSLRFAIAGAATVPENLFEQMLDVLGFETVAQSYGLTECVVATRSRPGEDPRHVAETTGPAVAGIEVRITGPDGAELPAGADGEILLRGANVMLGYFEDTAATDAAIDRDGWLHTGDVGRLDEHGCLKITDRLKDMFTVGGFNVYPAEVEKTLTGHPAVLEAAVIGIPDERLGTVGRAYLKTRPGSGFDESELTTYCRARLANFKVPRGFVGIEEFPRNASGKIVKNELPAAT